MESLIAALETAPGPSRMLDSAIAALVGFEGWTPAEWAKVVADPRMVNPAIPGAPRYTASLDAALTLVPRDGSVSTVTLAIWPNFNDGGLDVTDADLARFHPDEDTVRLGGCSMGDHPAISLCIAALKARRQAQQQAGTPSLPAMVRPVTDGADGMDDAGPCAGAIRQPVADIGGPTGATPLAQEQQIARLQAALAGALPFLPDAANTGAPAVVAWHRLHAGTIEAAAAACGRTHLLATPSVVAPPVPETPNQSITPTNREALARFLMGGHADSQDDGQPYERLQSGLITRREQPKAGPAMWPEMPQWEWQHGAEAERILLFLGLDPEAPAGMASRHGQNVVRTAKVAARALGLGDHIVLTVSDLSKTATGHVAVLVDTPMGRGNLFVLAPDHALKVARQGTVAATATRPARS